ncbi:helix-turn-helix domain-containing protein [Actinoplanes sp. NPDC026619]|uniref:helix-turn-helix domain-containing protein n=1 Tax=Actinoplanes sp. NPDC026619 TaxID=3155798 RepID=UPI0033F6CF29
MRDLAVRLAALDADAGAALRVISYFDSLTETRAGLQAIVRGAAVLAGCAARLDDHGRRVHVRVDPDGNAAPLPGPGDDRWMRTLVVPDGSATLALERAGEPGPVEAMILERAAGAARAVLDRTRGRVPAADPALVELIVDASAPSDVRDQALHKLHLAAAAGVRAVALPSGPALLGPGAAVAFARAGIGPSVAPAELPASYAAARVALRFAADGTPEDPGPTVVQHDSLGALAVLASLPADTEVPDLSALEHATAAAPWVLSTLYAFADAVSLRAAATTLRLHHSTLQDRIAQAAHLLGWPITTPAGRLRLQVALTLRRLRRHPA